MQLATRQDVGAGGLPESDAGAGMPMMKLYKAGVAQ